MDQDTSRRKVRSYTDDYKRQVVDLVVNGGRTAAAVASEVGLHPTLLARWVKQYSTGSGQGEAARLPPVVPIKPIATADQAAEIARLRRECDRLRMERDILKSPFRSLRVR